MTVCQQLQRQPRQIPLAAWQSAADPGESEESRAYEPPDHSRNGIVTDVVSLDESPDAPSQSLTLTFWRYYAVRQRLRETTTSRIRLATRHRYQTRALGYCSSQPEGKERKEKYP